MAWSMVNGHVYKAFSEKCYLEIRLFLRSDIAGSSASSPSLLSVFTTLSKQIWDVKGTVHDFVYTLQLQKCVY